MRTRDLGRVFGFIGAGLFVVGALLTFVYGVASAVVTHDFRTGTEATVHAVEEFVVGILVVFFSILGGRGPGDYRMAAGIILIVLALVAWFVSGVAGGVLGILGALFSLIGGILFLVDRA